MDIRERVKGFLRENGLLGSHVDVCLGREGVEGKESLALTVDGSGATLDITFELDHEGRKYVIHGDEVIVMGEGDRDREVWYYKFSGEYARRLHVSPHSEVEETKLDCKSKLHDPNLIGIESARLCYSEALNEADDFEVKELFQRS